MGVKLGVPHWRRNKGWGRYVLGARRDGGAGDWSLLHNEELHNLHSSPNIVWVIRTKRVRWGRGGGGDCGW